MLKIQDVDIKRGLLKVTRLKRKKKTKESLAVGKDLIEHLREYIACACFGGCEKR